MGVEHWRSSGLGTLVLVLTVLLILQQRRQMFASVVVAVRIITLKSILQRLITVRSVYHLTVPSVGGREVLRELLSA